MTQVTRATAVYGHNGLRRKLLLSLPASIALVSPLALVACGGNDGDAPPRNPLLDLPPGDMPSAAMRVAIEMPAGVTLAPAYVLSAAGSAAVAAGEATVDVFDGGPQLATVIAADGTPLLMGWVGTGRPALSAHSTATVLLHFGLGLPALGPLARDSLRLRLEAQPAVAALGAQIATLLAADPKVLATGTAALSAALVQAAEALLPPAAASRGRERAQGLTVEPATDLSGLQVVQGSEPNSVFIDNIYARRAVVVINRESWVDTDGQTHDEPQAPVQVGEVMELPLPSAVDSVANVVSGWANQYYTPDDPNSFFRSVSDSTVLAITPEAAKRTKYSVVVLMAGGLPITDMAAFERLPAAQKAYVRGLDIHKNLMFKTLLIDLLAPFFFSMLGEKLGEFAKGKSASEGRKELMEAFAGTLFSILQNQVPDVVQRISDGSLDAWGAFKIVGKSLTFDSATGAMSPLLQDALSKLAEFCVARLADVKLRSGMLEVATGLKIGGKGVLGILPVLKIIGTFDKVLGYLAQGRVVGDALRSRAMESWAVSAGKAKVTLRPDPLEVEITGVSYPITAEVVDNDDDTYGIEKGSIDFDWECTGLYGSLYSLADTNLAQPNKFTTSKNFATPNYLPSGKEADGAPETITVRAYFQPIGSNGTRELIGSATNTLKFKKAFSLRITPVTTEMPVDERLPLIASVAEKVPAQANIRFEWKLVSGAGSLNITVTDGDTANSQVDYLAPAGETTAVVEVVALVTVDPALPPTRTDPVTSTLKVKKGLRTIEMEVGGGVFGCTDPLACGVSQYTAFIVPRFAKAISHTARLSGFAYPGCNRFVTWNSVVGDGGDCNFPVTYHPHSSAGATNLWAVWIGFGGAFSGKCVVTITLRE